MSGIALIASALVLLYGVVSLPFKILFAILKALGKGGTKTTIVETRKTDAKGTTVTKSIKQVY